MVVGIIIGLSLGIGGLVRLIGVPAYKDYRKWSKNWKVVVTELNEKISTTIVPIKADIKTNRLLRVFKRNEIFPTEISLIIMQYLGSYTTIPKYDPSHYPLYDRIITRRDKFMYICEQTENRMRY